MVTFTNRIKFQTLIVFFTCANLSSALADEDCPKALTLVKKAHVSAFSREEVKTGLEEAIKLCPHMVEAVYEFGRFYFQEGKYDLAEEKFKEADNLKAKVEHSLGIALSQNARKDYAAAENTFKQALTTYLGHWSLLEGLAILYFEMNKIQESEELLRQALQAESGKDSIYYNLGLVLEKQKRFDEAITSYKTAIEKNNKCVQASIALMRLLQRTDDTADAVRVGERALLHSPANENLLFVLSDSYAELGMNGDAKRELNKISNPKFEIKKKVNLALLDAKNDNATKAIAELEILTKQSTGNIDILRGYGLALLINKEYQKAEQVFQQSLAIDENDAATLNNLGTAYEGMGQLDKAKDMYSRAQNLAGYKVIQENIERLK